MGKMQEEADWRAISLVRFFFGEEMNEFLPRPVRLEVNYKPLRHTSTAGFSRIQE